MGGIESFFAFFVLGIMGFCIPGILVLRCTGNWDDFQASYTNPPWAAKLGIVFGCVAFTLILIAIL
jgi:hypothetical protein